MSKDAVFKQLSQIGILPVVRSDTQEEAVFAAQALSQGGIPVVEITMTVPGAIDVIRELVRQRGDHLIIGAGTVTSTQECAAAIDAGSQFIVTPICTAQVIDLCREKEVCVIGGALTPSEIYATFLDGVNAVKVFPAKLLGGPAYLRTLSELFPKIPLVPTGGVNLETIIEYFKAGAALVGSGGDLVSRDALRRQDLEYIKTRAGKYVSAIEKAKE